MPHKYLSLPSPHLREVPEIPEPDQNRYYDLKDSRSYKYWLKIYNKLLAACSPEPITIIGSHSWKEGQRLVDGVDFNIIHATDARIFSHALGLDHKKMPLRGNVALPIDYTIPAKLDSNAGAFKGHFDNVAIPIQQEKNEKEKIDRFLSDISCLGNYPEKKKRCPYEEIVCEYCGVKWEDMTETTDLKLDFGHIVNIVVMAHQKLPPYPIPAPIQQEEKPIRQIDILDKLFIDLYNTVNPAPIRQPKDKGKNSDKMPSLDNQGHYATSIQKEQPKEEKKCCNYPDDCVYPHCPCGEENNEYYPGKPYQQLFNFFNEEHNLILTNSEMDDIILEVKKFLKEQ